MDTRGRDRLHGDAAQACALGVRRRLVHRDPRLHSHRRHCAHLFQSEAIHSGTDICRSGDRSITRSCALATDHTPRRRDPNEQLHERCKRASEIQRLSSRQVTARERCCVWDSSATYMDDDTAAQQQGATVGRRPAPELHGGAFANTRPVCNNSLSVVSTSPPVY